MDMMEIDEAGADDGNAVILQATRNDHIHEFQAVGDNQECIFCKMKKFQSLRGIWIHDYDKHTLAVDAVLVSIQVGLEHGTVKH